MTFAEEEKRIKGAFIALERSEERGGGRKEQEEEHNGASSMDVATAPRENAFFSSAEK